jgi:hypothetical protein
VGSAASERGPRERERGGALTGGVGLPGPEGEGREAGARELGWKSAQPREGRGFSFSFSDFFFSFSFLL